MQETGACVYTRQRQFGLLASILHRIGKPCSRRMESPVCCAMLAWKWLKLFKKLSMEVELFSVSLCFCSTAFFCSPAYFDQINISNLLGLILHVDLLVRLMQPPGHRTRRLFDRLPQFLDLVPASVVFVGRGVVGSGTCTRCHQQCLLLQQKQY